MTEYPTSGGSYLRDVATGTLIFQHAEPATVAEPLPVPQSDDAAARISTPRKGSK